MASGAHVIRRGRQSSAGDFPARPTLPLSAPCDGLAFVLARRAPSPDLRPLRDEVSAMWRGPLGADADAPDVLVVAFAAGTVVTSEVAAASLRLRETASGELASYADKAEDLDTARPRVGAGARRLDLWWGGRKHRLALDALERISLASLWSLPKLTIHQPAPRPVEASVEATRKAEPAGDGLAKVAHAKIAMTRQAADPMADIEAGLRDLEERTRLGSILKQMLGVGLRTVGQGQGKAGPAGAQPWGRPREPGVLENLAGWVRWHTPLGSGLRNKLSERQKLVEKYLAAGDLDSALKLALALGGGKPGEGRKSFPNALPGERSLDLSFTGPGIAAPIMGGASYENLHARYMNLAQRLETERDFRRAAYVYSKLLNDHRLAVQALERGELFREAAKLAIEAGLEPVLAIRLLFKAGELPAALALAKRTGCFDQLAEDSRAKEGAFHAYVVAAWTELLVATGQPLRALQVTDRLARENDAPEPLLDARARWLAAALNQEEGMSPHPELLARSLLMSSWASVSKADLDGFSHDRPSTNPDGAGAAAHRLALLLRGEAEDASRTLVELLPMLDRLAGPALREQASFWAAAGQPVMEAFVLGLLETASERLGAREIESARSLLDKAGLPVLAHDVSKLTKLYAAPSAKTRTWRVPPSRSQTPQALAACVLGSSHVMAWRANRLLQLFDRNGDVAWQQNLSDVVGLVPIGSSPNVIIIQLQPDGAHLLTRFASHRRSFHPIGRVRLSAWHDLTSEGQWLVQIGGEIGALDLVKLCAPSPEIEFLWSSQLTERLRVIAFAHTPGSPQWLTRDISEGRAGVLEVWTLNRTRELKTSVCMPLPAGAYDPPRPPDAWVWMPRGGYPLIGRTADVQDGMTIVDWAIEAERRAVDYARQRLALELEGRDAFQVCDFGRPFVRVEAGDTVRTAIVESDGRAIAFAFEHAPTVTLHCLARGPAARTAGDDKVLKAGPVVFADEEGRLFILDMQTLNVVAI